MADPEELIDAFHALGAIRAPSRASGRGSSGSPGSASCSVCSVLSISPGRCRLRGDPLVEQLHFTLAARSRHGGCGANVEALDDAGLLADHASTGESNDRLGNDESVHSELVSATNAAPGSWP